MKIKQITISNFHCYQNAVFNLGDRINVLIGRNGSGKTSFIKSIKAALSVFFSNNPSWGYPSIVGSVSDLGVYNMPADEIWHYEDMKPAEYVDIKVDAVRIDKHTGERYSIPSWSFHKYSSPSAKLQTTYYKDAYVSFCENIAKEDVWPLFAYYSDRYPHIEAKLSDSIKKMIDNDDKLYRAWAYYHWDYDTSCATIWQKRFMRIYNVYFKMRQMVSRLENREGEEYRQLSEQTAKYEQELTFVIHYMQKFTEPISDNTYDLQDIPSIRDIIVDGIENPYMVVFFTDGSRRRWDEMPAGYERLFNIVFDIAYRSYILNGADIQPNGIILIDELDLHLHPSLEQRALQRLSATFGDVQFIVSTHSPFVLANYQQSSEKHLYQLHPDDENAQTKVEDLFGMDYTTILRSAMETPENDSYLFDLLGTFEYYKKNNDEENALRFAALIEEAVGKDSRFYKEKVGI